MAEYIEKESFIEHENRQMHDIHDLGILCGAQGCLNDLKKFPAVDAVEVRHGWWRQNDNGTWSCSECSSWIPDEQHYYARFCLHCGARMDGRREDGANEKHL